MADNDVTNITQQDKDTLAAMEKQAGISKDAEGNPIEPALPTGAKIEVTKQEVKDEEKLDTTDKIIDDPAKITTPDAIATKDVTVPEKFDVETYEAAEAAPKLGEAEAAKGRPSEDAIMEAAQGQVSPEALATAATQELDPRATTQYQLAELFKGIEEGGPPPAWAAPAVRKVTAIMQQRGLGGSSMAAAATMQAMMESGIPIAAQDANKYATIQLQNLNNEQQAALQNAAAILQMDMANLNNRQQAAVNNAKAFLSMDMQNLTNEQQANTLTYQSKAQAL